MPSPLEAAVISALHAALRSELGVIVRTNDVRRARAIIYRFRKELGDPDLMCIQIRASPRNPENELFFVRMQEAQADD